MHVHSEETEEKGAYNFTSTHLKKHKKLNTNTWAHMHTTNHTHTQIKDKWEGESQTAMKGVHLESRLERMNSLSP